MFSFSIIDIFCSPKYEGKGHIESCLYPQCISIKVYLVNIITVISWLCWWKSSNSTSGCDQHWFNWNPLHRWTKELGARQENASVATTIFDDYDDDSYSILLLLAKLSLFSSLVPFAHIEAPKPSKSAFLSKLTNIRCDWQCGDSDKSRSVTNFATLVWSPMTTKAQSLRLSMKIF